MLSVQCHFVDTLHAPPRFAKFDGDQAIALEANAHHEAWSDTF